MKKYSKWEQSWSDQLCSHFQTWFYFKTPKADAISEDYFDAMKDRFSHSAGSPEGQGSAYRGFHTLSESDSEL